MSCELISDIVLVGFVFTLLIAWQQLSRLILNTSNIKSHDHTLYEVIFFRYVTCVVIASIGVAIGLLSIFVGSRMAELEQCRLYMERDGLPAVLAKKGQVSKKFLFVPSWFYFILEKFSAA